MAIDNSISSIGDFLKRNDELIKDINDAAGATAAIIEDLADRVDASREEAMALADQLGDTQFAVASDVSVKARQKRLLEEVAEVGKKIRTFRDEPDILVHLYAERATLYVGLANTYNDLVGQIVTFSQGEIDEIRVLLRRATLDAAARQRWADVLDGAVQVTKMVFRVAGKLVA